MFVGMREDRGRGRQHRPGRRAVGFGFAGPRLIVTSRLRRPPGAGRPLAHPPRLVTTVTPINIEYHLHNNVYKRVNLQGQAKRIAILGGTAPTSSQSDYFVDVPMGVYPGEAFRLNIEGDEFLIVCPDISVEGERIVVSIVRQ